MNLKSRITHAEKKLAPDFAAMTDEQLEQWADRFCPGWRRHDLSFLTDEQLDLIIRTGGDLSVLPAETKARLENEFAK